ncbi:hypothetical protein E3N88_28128 [Mikania micrantha]|uniref:Uncharacterized protein n=1 Tax=Mikania micrantha TaxID=192012 RepID=A0A5N6MZU2_9ASTR|nr:hypothetical protein E3N88_28128 [Mikania micrantha]
MTLYGLSLIRLTKSAHFIPIQEDYSMDRLAKLYVKEIVSRHGDANEENLAMIQESDAMLNAWVEQFIVEPQPEPEPQFEPVDLDEEDFDEDPDEDPDEDDDDGPADSGDSHSTIV